VTRLASMHAYRTIWISDLHLGTRGCKAEFLLDFLRDTEAKTIYLVGDIIDGWRLKKSWYWPQTANDVIQKVLRKVRKGTRVIYVPGNHDEWLREFAQLQFGGVEIMEDAIHVTADGRRLLVLHGDVFDAVVMHARWLKPWPPRRGAEGSRASSAATSTMLRCGRSAIFFIVTAATGSRAALLWSSISTGGSRFFIGSTHGASTRYRSMPRLRLKETRKFRCPSWPTHLTDPEDGDQGCRIC